MKFEWLRRDLDSSRQMISYQKVVLVGSLTLNILTALIALRMIGQERVIVVPPAIHKSFWVDSEKVSADYLEQMGLFLIQLVLDVTPQSVDYQSKMLLQYAASASYGEIKTAMAVVAERLKRDGAATVFSPQGISSDERGLKVAVQGELTTFIGDRRVSSVIKSYLIEFQYGGGKLTIKSFKETNPNDPLDTKAGAARATAGTIN